MLRPSSKPIVQNMNIAGLMDVNTYADVLGTSPAYRQKETIRWTTAFQLYHQMSSHDEDLSSPPNSPAEPAMITNDERNKFGSSASSDAEDNSGNVAPPDATTVVNSSADDGLAIPPPTNVDDTWSTIYRNILSPERLPYMSLPTNKYGFMTPPMCRPVSMASPKMGGSHVSPGESSLNSLELEAIAAVHELQFAVKDIFVSELLPRTSELIFLNLTSLEGQAYCVELTMKGWRVTSLRHDCMNGDYNHLDLHTRYFETIYALMDSISVNYRQKFSEALASKLTLLQELEKLQQQQQDAKVVILQQQQLQQLQQGNKNEAANFSGDCSSVKLTWERSPAGTVSAENNSSNSKSLPSLSSSVAAAAAAAPERNVESEKEFKTINGCV